jgi:preprotein translocase subunit SecG
MSDDEFLAKLTGAVAVIMFIMGIILGFTKGDTALRKEAILAGAAYYTNDASGKAQFKWKECK